MAKDLIHDAVKKALINDGWTITDDQFTIEYEDAKAFVDLAAERPIAAERGAEKIAVEIKSFLGPSPLHELENALGQYRFYMRLLEMVEPDRKLYLAISDIIEMRFFNRPSFRLIVQTEQISLIVVNIQREEIVKWIS
ncbi:MAG: XisH family protein [Blastocatellia bacterium]